MKTSRRMIAAAAMVVAMAFGGATAAHADQGEVACGYDYDACWAKWYDYGFVKNYIVGKIYYSGGGYHFYWWN